MSTCIITIRNSNWLKREIMLYQHIDGHPNSMLLGLTESLREIYQEFKDHGDVDWFLDPGRLAGVLIVRSTPIVTEDMKNLMKSLPAASKSRLESAIFLGLPSLFPEVSKSFSPNYEYSITLTETIDESVCTFFGYAIEVYKLQSGRRLSTIMTNQENFLPQEIPSVSHVIEN